MQSELTRVLAALLEVAKSNLAQQDSFGPFAMLLRVDADTLEYTGFETNRAVDDRTMSAILGWLRKEALSGAYRAVGYCSLAEVDLQSPPRSVPVIFANLEHSAGEAVEVYVPYEKRGGGYKYHRRIVREREPAVFVAGAGEAPAEPLYGQSDESSHLA